jgi:hypothetical protein
MDVLLDPVAVYDSLVSNVNGHNSSVLTVCPGRPLRLRTGGLARRVFLGGGVWGKNSSLEPPLTMRFQRILVRVSSSTTSREYNR